MQLLLRMQSVFGNLMNFYSAFFFLFYVQKPGFGALLVYTLLIWNLLSMVTQSPKTMMWATIILIYPFYFIDHVRSLYVEIVEKKFTRAAVLAPLTTWHYFGVVVLASIHLGICIMTSKENQESSELHKFVSRMEKKNKVNNDKYMTLIFRIYDLIRMRLNKVYRYIPIMVAIYTALHSISVLNFFLLVFAIFFLWNRRDDTKYWVIFNGYIIFILLIKQLCNFNLELSNYNMEFLGIVGIISIEEDQKEQKDMISGKHSHALRWLMVWNFLLVWFSSEWYKKLNKKITQKTLIQEQEDEKKLKKLSQVGIVNILLKIYNMGAMLFQYYSIWIYHMGANLILLSDTRDFINIVLLVAESATALIHIIIWNRQGSHPYKKVYRFWITNFYLVIFYAVFRYLMYFLKYTTVLNMVAKWMEGSNLELDRHLFQGIKNIPRSEMFNPVTFLISYTRPMMLLLLAVLTRETFLRMYSGRASYNPGLLKNSKNDLGQNEYEAQAFEEDKESFTREVETVERRTNPFVVLYLLFKGLFLGVVMGYLHHNMNVMKITMICCYLINMFVLFKKLIELCERMKVVELFSLRAQYFYYTFLTGKKWRKFGNEGKITNAYTIAEQKNDIFQNKVYYEQILVAMERVLFYVNRIFWGMVFFPLLFLGTTLTLLNYIVRNKQLAVEYRMDLFLGISSDKWLKEDEVTKELFGIQLVISGLFLEYMLTSFYLDCKAFLFEAKASTIEELLKNLEIKFRYFVDTRLEKIPREKADERLEEFMAAIQYVPVVKEEINIDPTPRESKENDLENTLKDDIEDNKEKSQESDEAHSEEEKPKDRDGSDYEDEVEEEPEEVEVEDEYAIKPDLEGAELLNNIILQQSKKQGPKSTIFYMTELVTKEEMLLFLNKNRVKYYSIKILESLLYIMSRVGIIPLLYPISSSINFLNVVFLVVFIVQNVTPKRTFLDDTKAKGSMVFIYFAAQSVHSFMHEQFKRYQSYADFFDMTKAEIPVYKRYLIPISGTSYSVCFYWLFIACMGFATIPVFVWTTTKFLFREKLSQKEHFHFYLFDQNRKRNIVIDYKKWRRSPLNFVNNIYKSVYTNALALHTFGVILILIAMWKDWFIMVFLFTLMISIYENFKPDITDQDTIMGMTRKGLLINITKVYSYLYWILLGVYHMMELGGFMNLFKEYNKNPLTFMNEYKFGVIVLVLMVITGVYQDLIMSEEFMENSDRLTAESMLKIRYANTCRAYDINEAKIYSRIVEIMRKHYIDELSNRILDTPDITSIKLNTNYADKDILSFLANSADDIKAKFLGFGKRLWLSSLDLLYSQIIYKSNNYRYMDMMFLYQIVQQRNRNILEHEEVNLEDYFDQNLNVFKNTFSDINIFYQALQESETERYSLYNEKIQEFLGADFGFKYDTLADQFNKVGANSNEIELPSNPFSTMVNTQLQATKEKANEIVNKTYENLLDAAELLSRAVQHRLNEETQYTLESYKLEFSRCGSIKCSFGRMLVVMFNTKQDYLNETKGFNIWKTKVVTQYLPRVIISNSEVFVSALLILIHIWYGGFINIVVVGIIIFTFFVEETTGRSFWWRILYICYLSTIMIKQVFDNSATLVANEKVVKWTFGTLGKDAMVPDTICILLVMYMIEFLKKYGVDGKSAIDFENPGQAISRLTVNSDFPNMLDRVVNEEVRKKELFNVFLASKGPSNNEIMGVQEFKMLMIKYLINNYSHLKKFTSEWLYCTQKFLRSCRFDITKVCAKDLDSFWFRNFSHYLRKSGMDYNGVASFILILLIVFVLLFFPTMSSENARIASFIFENKVTAFTVINFAIYLSFFVGHYYFDQMKTNDVKGLTQREYTLTLIGNYDASGKSEMQESRFGKLQSAANKIKNVMLLGKFWNKEDSQPKEKDYVKNPLLYMYFFCIVLWIYANVSVFFWHPLNSNFRSSGKKGIYKFICEDKDKAGDLVELGKLPCKNYSENYLSMIFYLLNILYIITCMLQIKAGKLFLVSKVTDFNKLGNLIQYKAYENIPLVRETRMTFEYCATRTSLFFSDFTLLKELEYVLHDAKMMHKGEMTNKTGKQLSRLVQNIICFIVIFIVILLFVVPLFLFYNSNNNSFFNISSSSVKISLMNKEGQEVLNLFKVSALKTNMMLREYSQNYTNELFNNYPVLRKYNKDQIMLIELSKSSEVFPELPPKLLGDLRQLIGTSTGMYLRTNITFRVS
jgi:hypothetical protein